MGWHTQIESVGPASCHVTCHVRFVYIEAQRFKTSAAVIGFAPNLCRFPITNDDISTGCCVFWCFFVVCGDADAVVLFTTYGTEWNDRTYNNKPFTQCDNFWIWFHVCNAIEIRCITDCKMLGDLWGDTESVLSFGLGQWLVCLRLICAIDFSFFPPTQSVKSSACVFGSSSILLYVENGKMKVVLFDRYEQFFSSMFRRSILWCVANVHCIFLNSIYRPKQPTNHIDAACVPFLPTGSSAGRGNV